MCIKLNQEDVEELRANINRVLKASHPPKPNLSKTQAKALKEHKNDRDRLVLTADKGVAMVIMDRQDYINKANKLLNQPAHRAIPMDPTNKILNRLINILKRVKNQTGLGNNTYKGMYPMGCWAPTFYSFSKFHRLDTHLRPILFSCGSATYGVAKNLPKF